MRLVLCSSLSSQMGADLAISFLINSKKISSSIKQYIIIFPPANARNVDSIDSVLFQNKNRIIIVNSYAIKILISFAVYTVDSYPLFFSKFLPINIELFEPRPNWYLSILGNIYTRRAKRFVNHLRKFFFNTELIAETQKSSKSQIRRYYYGDGFSLYCNEIVPFWLKPGGGVDVTKFQCESDNIYVFTFSMLSNNSGNVIKIPKKYCNDYLLSKYYDWFINSKIFKSLVNVTDSLKANEPVVVFTGTTFKKSGRLNNDNEASFYVDYINNIKEGQVTQFSNLLMKFHPEGDFITSQLTCAALKEGFRLIYSKEIDSIPLELLLIFLVEEKKVDKIYCTAITSGVAFALSVFEFIIPIFGFGNDLNEKYIKDEFLAGRKLQEQLIAEILSNKIN